MPTRYFKAETVSGDSGGRSNNGHLASTVPMTAEGRRADINEYGLETTPTKSAHEPKGTAAILRSNHSDAESQPRLSNNAASPHDDENIR